MGMSARETGTLDAVVVGAGLAGLTAARRLTAAGREVAVLEARDRVGGRTLNAAVGSGEVVEMGGEFVGPGQRRVLALLAELGLPTFCTHDAGRHVLEHDGRVLRYSGRAPRLNPLGLLDAGQAQWRLDRAARRVPPEQPWRAPYAERLDAETAATWIRRTARTPLGRTFLRLFVRGVFAAEPESISLLHLLFYVHAAGGFAALADTDGGAQQARVVGGSQLASVRMATELGGRLRLRAPVRSVEWSAGRVLVRHDGGTVAARRAVLAVPPALAGRIDFRPGLPTDRDQLLQRMPHGDVVKCMALYDAPWWRAQGLSGQAASSSGLGLVCYDNSPPSGVPGALLVFVQSRHAQALRRLPAEKRRAAVVDGLARLFGPPARRIAGWREQDWTAEEWTRGCYGAHVPPGVWTRYGPALRPPVGPLHWAGAETATRWFGYMDGAVESGERAAAEVLAALAPAEPAGGPGLSRPLAPAR